MLSESEQKFLKCVVHRNGKKQGKSFLVWCIETGREHLVQKELARLKWKDRAWGRRRDLPENHVNDKRLCEFCGADKPLDVHHTKYRNLYDVRLSDLRTLCRTCHDRVHEQMEK